MRTTEELFKKNFPQYVTETGYYLSPYWDIFAEGVGLAAHELRESLNETEELLSKQIEATYKLDSENAILQSQVEKMKCDVLSLVKDRMNDDIDQNIIERLADKWEVKEK